jgi:hypothetical protein
MQNFYIERPDAKARREGPTRRPDGRASFSGGEQDRFHVRPSLIDEYRLVVHPIALGKGLAIFDALDKAARAEAREQQRPPWRRDRENLRARSLTRHCGDRIA